MAKGATSVGFRNVWVALGLACLATVGTSSCVVDAYYADPCPCDQFINLCEAGCSCDPDCGGGPVTGGGYEEIRCVDTNDCPNLAQECLINDVDGNGTDDDSWCAGTCNNNGDCAPDGCCLGAEGGGSYCYPPRYCGATPTDGGPDAQPTDGGDIDATGDATGDATPTDGGPADAGDAATDAATDGGAVDAAADGGLEDAGPADATGDAPAATDGGVG